MSILEDEETLLNSGIESIVNAFKTQNEKYKSIISSLNNKVNVLQLQNEKLQQENRNYFNQVEQLKEKLNSISNVATAGNVDDDEVSVIYSNQREVRNKPRIGKVNSTSASLNYSHRNNRKNDPDYMTSYMNKTPIRQNPSQSFITNKSNQSIQSYATIRTEFSKYNSIQERINSLRNGIGYQSKIPFTNKSSLSKVRNIGLLEDSENIDQSENAFLSNDKSRSRAFQKTSQFLKECKLALNASNYEKLVKIFNTEKNPDKGKIKELLKYNTKLITMFDNL